MSAPPTRPAARRADRTTGAWADGDRTPLNPNEVFKAAEYDFYRIDPMLFAPAEVWVSHLDSGATFHAGRCDFELLARHWLQEA